MILAIAKGQTGCFGNEAEEKPCFDGGEGEMEGELERKREGELGDPGR